MRGFGQNALRGLRVSAMPVSVLVMWTAAVASMPACASTRVLVIHGFGAHQIFLEGIARHLRRNGYDARTWGYPSVTEDMPRIVERLRSDVARQPRPDTIDFVTHSMGGIVVRSYLEATKMDTALPFVYRIVMIAPPNKGSELADFFTGMTVLRWIMGPNLSRMRTDSASYVNRLPAPGGKEVGIIAGIKFGPRTLPVRFDTAGDGYVSVPRTRLGMERDFVTLDEGHSLIILRKQTRDYTLCFLRDGRFAEECSPCAPEDSRQ